MARTLLWRVLLMFSLMMSPLAAYCTDKRCQSFDKQYNSCTIRNLPDYARIFTVSVRKERGRSDGCDYGVSYGFTDDAVWTDKGCRADFVVCYENVTITTEPTTEMSVEPSSGPLDQEQKSNAGGVVGGVIAGLVVVAAAVAGAIFLFRRYNIQLPCQLPRDKSGPPPDEFADPDYNPSPHGALGPRIASNLRPGNAVRSTENNTYDSLSSERDQHHYKGFYGQTNQTKDIQSENQHSYMVLYDSSSEPNQHNMPGNALSNASYYDEITPAGSQGVKHETSKENAQYDGEQCYYNVNGNSGSSDTNFVNRQYDVIDPDVTGVNRHTQNPSVRDGVNVKLEHTVTDYYAVLDPHVTGFNRQIADSEDIYELAKPISE